VDDVRRHVRLLNLEVCQLMEVVSTYWIGGEKLTRCQLTGRGGGCLVCDRGVERERV